MSQPLSDPAKLLLLTSLLAADGIITNNGKTFLKELILRRDPRLMPLLNKFEEKDGGDNNFVEDIHDLIMNEASELYEELFEDTSLEVGKTLSKEERERKDLNKEKSLIYGEVEFSSFYRVLRKINPTAGSVFYDLGSGTGKAVFVARFTQDFSKCIGIEILEGLHNQASVIVQRYNEEYQDKLYHGQQNYAACYEGSFLDYDWSDGDIVFANSTCFDDDLMESLSEEAENLKPGAIVVTFTKGMTTKKFEVLERKRYKMSWGPATVFIHRRLNENGTPVGPPNLNILPSDNVNFEDEDTPAYTFNYNYNNNDDDDDDEDDEDDEEDEEEDDEDDIDENQNDDEEEEDEKDQEDDEEDEEENDDDDEDEEDIDEYIRKITGEINRNKYINKTVDSEDDQEDNDDEDESEEENGDADDEEDEVPEEDYPDEEAQETGSSDDERKSNDDDDEDDDGVSYGDGSEDLNAVAEEMEEQIRQITERINYNKTLINSYTDKLNSPNRGGGASSSSTNSPAGMSGYSKESTSPSSARRSPHASPAKQSSPVPNTQPVSVPVTRSSPGKTGSLSIQSPNTRDNYNAEFLAMTSPQDSALQARKRLAGANAAARKLQANFDRDMSDN